MATGYPRQPDTSLAAVHAGYLADETAVVRSLLGAVALNTAARENIARVAGQLVAAVRARQHTRGGLDAFLREYDLSSHEGIVLMCIAEALLRIPDRGTADRLIRGKLAAGEWDRHLGHSTSLLVNASTWGLMLTGRLVTAQDATAHNLADVLKRVVARSGESVIRHALAQAMRILGEQFVLGETMEQALERRHSTAMVRYRFSFDMLGEAAMTQADAERYFAAYQHAIGTAGASNEAPYSERADSISVKLSALHPRFEILQKERVLRELTPRLLELAQNCRDAGIGLTIDAEEADRLALTLEVFREVFSSNTLVDWQGLGIAVQAYQKRAIPVLEWLAELAARHGRRIPLRLVKGAYWDTEIKRAQQQGLDGYPVFTRKAATDLSYLACVRTVLKHGEVFYPQFATHNAHTVAAVIDMAGPGAAFELQRLQGMGGDLYEEITGMEGNQCPCRIYAPVGGHKDLLPYLVRRLLENGVNTSFVNRIANESIAVAEVIADPISEIETVSRSPGNRIPLPVNLYGERRANSRGVNLGDENGVQMLIASIHNAQAHGWLACPVQDGKRVNGVTRKIVSPADHGRVIGQVTEANDAMIEEAVVIASTSFPAWNATPVDERARCLERAADLFEHHRTELMALCIAEAGKTIPDAMAEVREAIDYCRYYALEARQLMGLPRQLDGVTGESNELRLRGRGVFVCISPWNFPLAIFVGQIAAALVTGNTVIAKPAEQTPLIAARAIDLMLAAGILPGALALLPGSGRTVGAGLCRHAGTNGVVFTGSTATAWSINRALAARETPIAPLIAETGGQNVMIVDSSALPEQVVRDAVRSAFNSAGQRCSALRVLYLQQDIADQTIEMLRGAIAELRIGDPALATTDVGPVIDQQALDRLTAHVDRMDTEAKLIYRAALPEGHEKGTFLAPHAYELEHIRQLKREVFGPVLHVIRYRADHLDSVIDDINSTGYGLTLGIHSRVDETISYIVERVRVGNVYVNRDMIGAAVGVQPFGGRGLSGTGPKAGGPCYLQHFVTELTVTTNTAAIGGNPALLTMKAT